MKNFKGLIWRKKKTRLKVLIHDRIFFKKNFKHDKEIFYFSIFLSSSIKRRELSLILITWCEAFVVFVKRLFECFVKLLFKSYKNKLRYYFFNFEINMKAWLVIKKCNYIFFCVHNREHNIFSCHHKCITYKNTSECFMSYAICISCFQGEFNVYVLS